MSNEIIRAETYPTGRVEIILNDCAENPRTMYDHAGIFTSANRHYLRSYYVDDRDAPSNLREMALGIGGLALPVYHYEDSGRLAVGCRRTTLDVESPAAWIYMTSETARKEQLVHPNRTRHAGKINWKRVENLLRSEVSELSSYFQGETYGWMAIAVNPLTGEETDVASVWGYIGEDSIPSMVEEGRCALPVDDANREFDLAEAMAA